MDLANRATILTPSLTLSIDSKAKAMKAEGIDVCSFGAGEPDFDTPDHIKAAAQAAIETGFTKYTPSSGIPELRQAISEKFAADNQLNYKPSQVIVSCGRPSRTNSSPTTSSPTNLRSASSATARNIPATTPSSPPASPATKSSFPRLTG